MLDFKFVCGNPDAVKESLARTGADTAVIDQIKYLYENNRMDEASELLGTVRNLPDRGVPDGATDADNGVVRTIGQIREYGFTPRSHLDLGERLHILDMARGKKVSGDRFYFLSGAGAALQRALVNWMLDLHVNEHGYTEICPPYVTGEKSLYESAYLPKSKYKLYKLEDSDLWLVPTAEVPLTSMYRDEVLEGTDLPLKYAALTSCFRREPDYEGQDLFGLRRGHQFEKIELMKITRPEQSDAELYSLLDDAEDICRRLEIPYRVVAVCAGMSSFVATTQYDIEVSAPVSGNGPEGDRWLEVSSCSNIRDFQARRANIRYTDAGGSEQLVHTVNGSGVGLPRLLIAILENYQNEDGSVTIPTVLRPYMGGKELIA